MKEFDIEKLERKNIYKVPDNLFENIQEKVMNEVKVDKKAPIFKLNWVYAAAASLALIFGITFVLNYNDSANNPVTTGTYTQNNPAPKSESEKAYETLKSDLTSVENNNQIVVNQKDNISVKQNETEDIKAPQTAKTVSKQTEAQMTEYLDSFSNSEIAELANNSTQDIYLDLYN
ncbi:hypothetical protein PMI13_00605 [Chryseobacterium populi]|uniref:Uncharacterized protein n=2 Tax=Chryseobacterium populi TaxID=1144316 RepID=J2KPZ8_9FLAO|nr:hypothetical protein PMI13_00605 [Chryseobacterium populi]